MQTVFKRILARPLAFNNKFFFADAQFDIAVIGGGPGGSLFSLPFSSKNPYRLRGSNQSRTTWLEDLLHREEGIPRWHLFERGVHSFQGAPQHFPQIRGKHQAFR